MKALVVAESVFGNTRRIADAIAEGLAGRMEVTVADPGEAGAVGADVDLVVAGGPTHAFGMTSPRTRQSAVDQHGASRVDAVGLREFIAGLAVGDGRAVATFDTRADRPRVPGSAARAAHRRLRRLGFRPVAPAESFRVRGTAGPLVDGEVERARTWGEALARRLEAPGPVARPGGRADR